MRYQRIIETIAKQYNTTPEEVDDYTAQQMARDIANQVEETMQYPGQIKVTVIRETRAVEYAK